MFLTQVAAEQVAAIIVEPVQGEGGFLPAPQAFLEGLRAICDEHGICLIVDEVQTGFARTGKLFAIEHYGVEPDLITVAKSIAAGLPLSGVLGKAEIMDAAHDGAVGGTFVGNPVAQAAALAVLDVIEEEGLVRARHGDRRDDAGAHARAGRSGSPRSATCAGSARCWRSSSSPTARRSSRRRSSSQAVIEAALQRGLLLLKAGVHGNCDPRARAARDHRRRARRGARRLGRRPGERALVAARGVRILNSREQLGSWL